MSRPPASERDIVSRAAALIAEILALKGDSYRLRDRDLARPARDD